MAVMPVAMMIVIGPGFGADSRASRCADRGSDGCAASAADRCANTGADRAADNSAAERIGLSRNAGS